MKKAYSKGTIKVVWIEDNEEVIYSKMFDSEDEAVEFAEDKKDYLIFKLKDQKHMRYFTWKLLPYGKQEIYSRLFHIYKKGVLNKIIKK